MNNNSLNKIAIQLSNNQIYWTAQILGWLLYGGFEAWILAFANGHTMPNGFIFYLGIVVMNIFISHQYRIFIRKYKLNSKPFGYTILAASIGALIMGNLLQIIGAFYQYLYNHPQFIEDLNSFRWYQTLLMIELLSFMYGLP